MTRRWDHLSVRAALWAEHGLRTPSGHGVHRYSLTPGCRRLTSGGSHRGLSAVAQRHGLPPSRAPRQRRCRRRGRRAGTASRAASGPVSVLPSLPLAARGGEPLLVTIKRADLVGRRQPLAHSGVKARVGELLRTAQEHPPFWPHSSVASDGRHPSAELTSNCRNDGTCL